MAQRIRALDALPKDPRSVPSTLRKADNGL